MENTEYQWLPVRAFVLESKVMEVFGVIAMCKFFKQETPPLQNVFTFIENELSKCKCEKLSKDEINNITNKYNATTESYKRTLSITEELNLLN